MSPVSAKSPDVPYTEIVTKSARPRCRQPASATAIIPSTTANCYVLTETMLALSVLMGDRGPRSSLDWKSDICHTHLSNAH
jgi:hypothetical protein